MQDITMPKLSDSMTEGRIVQWKVAVGDTVHEGDVLAEVESDKAVMELECFHDGAIAELLFDNDAEVKVGEVIARLAEEGDQAPAKKKKKKKKASKEEPPKEEEEEEEEEEKEEPEEREGQEQEQEQAPKKPEKKAEPRTPRRPAPQPEGQRPRISPYARKLAEREGVDVSTLKGSGPRGRIVAKDVHAAVEAGKGEPEARTPKQQAPAAAPAEQLPPIEVHDEEADVEDAPYRLKTQARYVLSSQRLVPHFYVTAAVNVTSLLKKKEPLKNEHGATLTHVILLAAAKALGRHPEIRRTYDRDKVVHWKQIHLGIAVDTDEGLTVAVLHDAGGLSLAEIVQRSGELIDAARAGKLKPEQRRNPILTVSNLGMFGVEHFEPIINPPSAITMGVSAALDAAVVADGKLAVGKVMRLTLSCDHRTIEGAPAARFLQTLTALLEAPEELLGDA